ncbi:uncharacterized protein [Panulirus ornatus]|uniref:uncharacterized protein n=1 Tax=Panulirus ornatus TaxID=150431 RepID=UPI003A85DBB5
MVEGRTVQIRDLTFTYYINDNHYDSRKPYTSALHPQGNNTYEFGYDTRGGRTGARFFRHEEKGADGRLRGQYGFVDANDDLHVVVYVTDVLGHRIRKETHKIEGYGRQLSKILEKGASSAQVKDRINVILKEQSSSNPPRITSSSFTTVSRPLTATRKVRRTTLRSQVPTGPEPYFLDDDEELPLISPQPLASRQPSDTFSQGNARSPILNQVTPSPASIKASPASTTPSPASTTPSPASTTPSPATAKPSPATATPSPALAKISHLPQGLTPPPIVFPMSFDDTHQQVPGGSLSSTDDTGHVSPPATIITAPPSLQPDADAGVKQTTPGPEGGGEVFPPPPKFPTVIYPTKTIIVHHTTSAQGFTPPSTFHTHPSPGHVSGNGHKQGPSVVIHAPQPRPATSDANATPPLPLSLTIPLRYSLSDEEYQELRDYLRRILSSDRNPMGTTVLQKVDVTNMGTTADGVAPGSLGTKSGNEGDLSVFVDRDVIDGGIIDGGIIDGGIIDGGIIDDGIIYESGVITAHNIDDAVSSGTVGVRSVSDGCGRACVVGSGAADGGTAGENQSDIIDGGIIDGGIINIDTLTSRELELVAQMGTKPTGFRDALNGYTAAGDHAASQQQQPGKTSASGNNRRSVFSESQPGGRGHAATTTPPVSLIDQLIASHRPGYPGDLDERNLSNSPTGEAQTLSALHYIPSPDLSTDGPIKGDFATSFPRQVSQINDRNAFQGTYTASASSKKDFYSRQDFRNSSDEEGHTRDTSPRHNYSSQPDTGGGSSHGEHGSPTPPHTDHNTGRAIKNHPSHGHNAPGSSGNTRLNTAGDATVALASGPQERRSREEGEGQSRGSRPPSINLVRSIKMNHDDHSSVALRPAARSSGSPSRSSAPQNLTVYVTTTGLSKTVHLSNNRPKSSPSSTHLTHHVLPIHLSMNLPQPNQQGPSPLTQVQKPVTDRHTRDHNNDPTRTVKKQEGSDVATSRGQARAHEPSQAMGLLNPGGSGHLSTPASPPGQAIDAARVSTATKALPLAPRTSSGRDTSDAATLQPPAAMPPPPPPPSHTSTLPPSQILTDPPSQGHRSFGIHMLPPHLTHPSPPLGPPQSPAAAAPSPHWEPQYFSIPSSSPSTPPHSPHLQESPQGPHGLGLGRTQSSGHPFPPPPPPPQGLPQGVPPEDVVPILHHGPPLIPTTQRSFSFQKVTFHNYPRESRAGGGVALGQDHFSGRWSRR